MMFFLILVFLVSFTADKTLPVATSYSFLSKSYQRLAHKSYRTILFFASCFNWQLFVLGVLGSNIGQKQNVYWRFTALSMEYPETSGPP